MRPLGGLLLALLVVPSMLLAGCVEAEPPEGAMVDASGQPVDVSDLSRIVATSHDLVEILYQLDHAERVVAVPSWIDHPVDAKGLPPCADDPDAAPCSMGRPHVLNVEEILMVDPSLVLLKDHPLQPTGLAAGLRSAGIPVFVFRNDETLDNIHYTYETVGAILATVDPDVHTRIDGHTEGLDAQLRSIEQAVANSTTPHPVALYQLPVGFVAGAGTSADLLLRLAGARNLATEAGTEGYQQISKEVIVDADPERIVAEFTAASSPDVFFASPRYAETTAARWGPETLLIVDPATTALVGPRFLDGTREVAEWLHPVAFGLFTAEVSFATDGRTLQVEASAEGDASASFTYRLDPGDGSGPRDATDGRFTHTYSESGDHQAVVLVIDDAGRIHEVRQAVEV